jgi:uncharacterized protein
MEQDTYTNLLINETSPYLLQHSHNPVDWYPWSEEAFDKARNENKLVIISIGYAACHWCHVMEHESFEDTTVANLMNQYFVSIKIDREERPDIDQVYIEAVQLMNGNAGWPLNCIVLPDGRPIYGGTYFRKSDWMHVLRSLHNTYVKEPQRMHEFAGKMMQSLDASSANRNAGNESLTKQKLKEIVVAWERGFDPVHGGDGNAPKFPMPNSQEFLLHYASSNGNSEIMKQVELSLDKMAAGGIYDQIGGGFARYSVDAKWKVPHFEKMLYDNGQLISLYSKAYVKTGNDRYKEVVYETIDFIDRELSGKNGNFFCSLDADSEGVEGKFYLWTESDFDRIFADRSRLLKQYFGVGKEGKWEGSNILLIPEELSLFCQAHKLDLELFRSEIEAAKKVLLARRSERIRPGLDDKTLTSWNALMLNGLLDAYSAFGENQFLDLAIRNAGFLKKWMIASDYRVMRNYKNGKISINGFLDDYSFLTEACFKLYNATLNHQWLSDAQGLIEYTLEHFYDEKSGLFYYTSDLDPKLITRKQELSDNVIPSSNSAMARNLYMASLYFGNSEYFDLSQQMLSQVSASIGGGGKYFSNWLQLMLLFTEGSREIVVVGANAQAYINKLNQQQEHNILITGSTGPSDISIFRNRFVDGETLIYCCENRVCQQPFRKVEDALNWMGSF